MVYNIDISKTIGYDVPDISIPHPDLKEPMKVGSANIESIKIKSIENEICKSKIFDCIKESPTFSGGTKLFCRYKNGTNKEYLKVQSYWNSQEIMVELKSNPDNPNRKEALDLVNIIVDTIKKEEDPEKVKEQIMNARK